ncbi:Pyridine nucleotide-disulphide oxidoreductase, class I [Oleispira antarctica RB-8]|uniref:Pyridine nucleotide-disulphide oxidoreductase, class I n=1 Tax=Oleispira antarctica RB-8 TaxID=698738 RepID=R4YKY6_OLEAN|nr:Pyridine nucleotide-disulphide oxidoreductase, class I [Oleispira antarctica RB-8]
MQYDVIIIGAGAAGLMCAAIAGQRGRSVLVLDHANKAGKKILMSGGGRCNFTNYYVEPDRYLCHNTHFCKSALSRYTQWDFIGLVEKHGIPYHEKQLGELFCDNKASDILEMLLSECDQAGAKVQLNTSVDAIHSLETESGGYKLNTTQGEYTCESLVVASGGLSIPTLGASGFGYQVAEQFNLKTYKTRAGLVPFTITNQLKDVCIALSGSSCEVIMECNGQSFRGNMLFTHRGLSGPAVLQISSYWQAGQPLTINLLPDIDLAQVLRETQHERPKLSLKKFIAQWLTQKMSEQLVELFLSDLVKTTDVFKAEQPQTLAELNAEQMDAIAHQFNAWQLVPSGTEGYRTAEVTLGGIDTDEVSSKTMMSKNQQGLYFIGEVLDVTGHLGGFNFQWAWASGWAAAQYV